MQVFHTAGEPPSNGSISLPNRGCKINIRVALTKSVPANTRIKERLRSERVDVLGMCKRVRGTAIIGGIVEGVALIFKIAYFLIAVGGDFSLHVLNHSNG
jgi:hypothetical protein